MRNRAKNNETAAAPAEEKHGGAAHNPIATGAGRHPTSPRTRARRRLVDLRALDWPTKGEVTRDVLRARVAARQHPPHRSGEAEWRPAARMERLLRVIPIKPLRISPSRR